MQKKRYVGGLSYSVTDEQPRGLFAALNNTQFEGRTLNVNLAKPREDGPPGAGGAGPRTAGRPRRELSRPLPGSFLPRSRISIFSLRA
jgi:RNA recognition motif-containing protein